MSQVAIAVSLSVLAGFLVAGLLAFVGHVMYSAGYENAERNQKHKEEQAERDAKWEVIHGRN